MELKIKKNNIDVLIVLLYHDEKRGITFTSLNLSCAPSKSGIPEADPDLQISGGGGCGLKKQFFFGSRPLFLKIRWEAPSGPPLYPSKKRTASQHHGYSQYLTHAYISQRVIRRFCCGVRVFCSTKVAVQSRYELLVVKCRKGTQRMNLLKAWLLITH